MLCSTMFWRLYCYPVGQSWIDGGTTRNMLKAASSSVPTQQCIAEIMVRYRVRDIQPSNMPCANRPRVCIALKKHGMESPLDQLAGISMLYLAELPHFCHAFNLTLSRKTQVPSPNLHTI